MATQDQLPDFRNKRKLLFGSKTSAQQMLETGRKFMQAERFDDALEFLSRTEATQEVRQIAVLAAERGDTALFLRAKVVLKEAPTQEELEAVARKAEDSGRRSTALTAYVKAGRTEQAERLRVEMGLSSHPEQAKSTDSAPAEAEPQE
jgi:hypothetical protein